MKRKKKEQTPEPKASGTGSDSFPIAHVEALNHAMMESMGLKEKKPPAVPRPEMPPWTLKIVDRFKRTIFKPILAMRPYDKVDWRNYGKMIGQLERYKTFLLNDLNRICEEYFGDVTDEQWNRVEPLIPWDKFRAGCILVLNRPVKDDETTENLIMEALECRLEKLEEIKATAFSYVAKEDAKNGALFFKGMSEGYGMIIDESGKFCGDRGRTDIYLNLLASMMEVETLRRKNPQPTRPQFYDHLSAVFKLPPKAYDWFNDVCDDIKLPIKSVGAPRKNNPTA